MDLRGVGEDAVRQLLAEVMNRSKLTYPLAKVFIDAGHDALSRYVWSGYRRCSLFEHEYRSTGTCYCTVL